jgi:alpha-tubulin suppressor-like RCC1 family protein
MIPIQEEAAGPPPLQDVEVGPAPPRPRDYSMEQLWRGNGAGIVAAGDSHSVVLNLDGSVSVFGDNRYGQLGINEEVHRSSTPLQIPGIEYIVCVSAGYRHTALVTGSGRVLTFGLGTDGQLGYGGVVGQYQPREVPNIFNAIGVSCGQRFTMVVLRGGNVVAFGNNCGENVLGTDRRHEDVVIEPSPVVNLPYPVIAVACGSYHSLFLLADGRVAALGLNSNGQLGFDGDFDNRATPVILPYENVVSISAWGNFSAIILGDGRVVSFGRMTVGRENILTFPEINNAQSVSGSGPFHWVVVQADGSVWRTNQRAPFTGFQRLIGVYDNAIAVVCGTGGRHTLIRHADGHVSSYGVGPSGELGRGAANRYNYNDVGVVPGVG